MIHCTLRVVFFVFCMVHCLSFTSSTSHERSEGRKARYNHNHHRRPHHYHHRAARPSAALNSSAFLFREWQRVQNFSIVFNKIKKCSSSSAAGVMRTIGFHRHATADTQMNLIKEWDNLHVTRLMTHEPFVLATHHAVEQWSQVRKKAVRRLGLPVFVAAWVRDPMERCYSEYYFFKIYREHREDTTQNRINHIMKSCSNALVSHLKLAGDARDSHQALSHNKHHKNLTLEELQKTWVQSWDPTQVEVDAAFVEQLLGEYHFIGVTERFDESLVVLKWLLGLELRDILHISAKRPGMLDDRKEPVLSHPDPDNEADPVIKKYLQTEFQKRNVEDFAVLREANRQLDIMIAAVPGFETQLRNFRVMQAAVASKCWTATPMDDCACLYHDNACCIDCVDTVAESTQEILLAEAKLRQFETNETVPEDFGRQWSLNEVAIAEV